MHIHIPTLGLLLTLAGCSVEPERSRIVTPSADVKLKTADPANPVTKDPRRIATH